MVDIDGFLEYMYDEEFAESTRKSYMYAVRSFSEKYDDVNKSNIVAFKQELMSDKSPKTVNLRLTAIKKYCQYKGLRIDIKRVKIQKTVCIEDVLTIDEYSSLLEGLIRDNDIRHAIIVILMAKTGARISEILRFRKRDLQKDYIDLHTKGKVRRIYFPDGMKKQIAQWTDNMKDDDYLCQNRFGKKITPKGVNEFLKSCSERYGITKSHLHAHSFRHMFAIEFLKRNNNISLLADLLGHSGINTTMIYLRMSQRQQKEEINKAVDW